MPMKPSPPTAAQPPKSALSSLPYSNLVMALAIAIITLLTFKPILEYDFVNWDDDATIYKNDFLQAWDKEHLHAIFTHHVNGGYNPLTILSFAIDVHWLGYDIEKGGQPFHRVNWLLHTANAVIVFFLLLALRLPPWAAFFGALLFGIHPMRVESVAWVTERKDVLFGFFYLLCLLIYARTLESPRRWLWYGIMIVLAILSGLSKIQAVSLPLSMLAIDYLLGRKFDFKLLMGKLPFFLISLAIGLIGVIMLRDTKVLDSGNLYTLPERMVTGSYTLAVYLLKCVWPYEMSPLYAYTHPMPGHYYLGIPVSIAFFALMIWLYKKGHRPILFGLLFFFVNIVFMLQILSAGQGLLADRFTYMAYLGLFYVSAWALHRLYLAKPTASYFIIAFAGLYAAALLGATRAYMPSWKNGETLWTHAMKINPQAQTPYNNRGNYRHDHKQYEQAISDFNKSLTIQQDGKIYNDRGVARFYMNDLDRALEDFNKGISLSPDYGPLYVSRGSIYGAKNKFPEALADFDRGIELDSTQEKAYLNRGLLHYLQGHYELAIKDHSSRIRLLPGEAETYYQRALCYNLLNKPEKALPDLNKAASLDKRKFGPIYAERAKTYLMLGQKEAAKADVAKAQSMGQQIDPSIMSQLQ